MKFEGNELIDEIRNEQAERSFELCDLLIDNYPKSVQNGQNQKGKSTFYKKRNREDSELDINKTLIENFNLLRTVDNKKYPAFFCKKRIFSNFRNFQLFPLSSLKSWIFFKNIRQRTLNLFCKIFGLRE